MTRIYLVRHGESTWNQQGRIQGHQDPPLSDLGRAQMARVACRLESEHPRAVFASDLRRSVESAHFIAAHCRLEVQVCPEFREANFGRWEGLTLDEVAERWPTELAAWKLDSSANRPTGGETLESLRDRATGKLQELVDLHTGCGGGLVLAVHGGPIKAIITHTLRAPLSSFRRFTLDNASLSVVTWSKEGQWLLSLNDCCHLEGVEEELSDRQ